MVHVLDMVGLSVYREGDGMLPDVRVSPERGDGGVWRISEQFDRDMSEDD